jgi:glycosyltransferase involved in cell wall biosynthesis
MLGGKCAASIVVLYNFDPDLSEILNSISRRSLDYAIFVDNSDKKLISNKLNTLSKSYPRIFYIKNPENIGLARAMNMGIKKAIGLGAEYVFVMDQDARLADNYFEILYSAYMEIVNYDEMTGVVGPIVSNKCGKPNGCQVLKSRFSRVVSLINSGMLISAEMFKSVGLFNEDLFLGAIDTDYVSRIIKYGRSAYRVNLELIRQDFGKTILPRGVFLKVLGLYTKLNSMIMIGLGKSNEYRFNLVYYDRKQNLINKVDAKKANLERNVFGINEGAERIVMFLIEKFGGLECTC